MSIRPLTLEEAQGTVNSVIIEQIFKNPNISKVELYDYLLNSSVKGITLKLLPTLKNFQDYLPSMNFHIKN